MKSSKERVKGTDCVNGTHQILQLYLRCMCINFILFGACDLSNILKHRTEQNGRERAGLDRNEMGVVNLINSTLYFEHALTVNNSLAIV